MTELTREQWKALAAPFADDLIDFLPRAVGTAGKAIAMPYIEARAVMSRLDEVAGPGGWSFNWEPVGPTGKAVKGILTVAGVTKCDAGEANAEDEPLKAAVSDALKRCGVHFGIARYLYALPAIWGEYDREKRRWRERPEIPPRALAAALATCGYQMPERNPAEDRKERVRAAAEASPANRSPVRGVVGKPALRIEQGGEPVTTPDGHEVDASTGEVQTDEAAAKAADVALLGSFERAGLDPKLPGLMRKIASVALGREVPVFRNLGPQPRHEVAAWVDAHRDAAQGICTDVQAELSAKAG